MELKDEGEEKAERISYDEALTKYGTGRFLLFQFSKFEHRKVKLC